MIINLPKDSNSIEIVNKLNELISQSKIQHTDLNRTCEEISTQLQILNMYLALITNQVITKGDI